MCIAPSSRADECSVASVDASATTLSSSAYTAAPPQLSKVTAFEFMQAWNGLKGTTDIEQYVGILDQIQPSDIPKGAFDMSFFAFNFSLYILQSIVTRHSKVTGYSSSQHASLLRELTCHVGSRSISCHPAEVTFPPLLQLIKAGTILNLTILGMQG